MTIIRKAALRDVPALDELIGRYARERLLLPRTLSDLYENVREFTVAEEDGRILGCGALKFYNQELAEIRSLCVEQGHKAHGVGSSLLKELLDEARRCNLKNVFALTLAAEFFRKSGFRETHREKVPLKISRDCRQCELYGKCNEKTMILVLANRLARRVATHPEASLVTA